jgi:hypothetical protein
MKYTLITQTGQIFQFFLESLAKSYQLAYGGTLITNGIFTQKENVS